MLVESSKILEAFPHQTIQPIVDQLSYKSISELHLKLNKNWSSVHSNRGNELLVLLSLNLEPEVYNSQSSVIFIPQFNLAKN